MKEEAFDITITRTQNMVKLKNKKWD